MSNKKPFNTPKTNSEPRIDWASQVTIIDEKGQPFDVPIDGSLGLLALGAQGVIAWKQRRMAAGWEPPTDHMWHKSEKENKADEPENKDKPKGDEPAT